MTPRHIAVFGTLRGGQPANRMMGPCVSRGTEILAGTMFSLGWFPGIKLYTNDTFVAEIYELPSDPTDLLARLDAYEGEGSLYHRRTIETSFGPTFIYEYAGEPHGPAIYDWTNRQAA